MKKEKKEEKKGNNQAIKLDANNMFVDKVGYRHGFKKEIIDKYRDKTVEIHQKIKKDCQQGKIGFMELPYQEQKLIEDIKEYVAGIKGEIENFVVLGIGGSALGSIALRDALSQSSKTGINNKPELYIEDNIDPLRFKNLLKRLDLSRTVFNVISKSGGTAETMSQFLIARDAVIEKLGKNSLSDHFVATTSQDSGYLIEIARRENLKTFYIPENVGGRFSVLSPVGLLFAELAGIDIEQLLAGARYMDKRCNEADIWENPAYLNALLEYLAYQNKKPISVIMPYSHQLRSIGDWFIQLWSESLGKEINRNGQKVHVGPTPVNSLGVTDQHSQVQLFMEGPYDKIITFLEVENFATEIKIPEAYTDIEGVSYLGGHTLNELLITEKKATELALTKRERLNKTIIVPEVNEFTIGQLFYLLELQTAFIGELFDINAYNQPGVELGKQYAYGVLGRKGFQDKKQEYQNRPDKDDDLII